MIRAAAMLAGHFLLHRTLLLLLRSRRRGRRTECGRIQHKRCRRCRRRHRRFHRRFHRRRSARKLLGWGHDRGGVTLAIREKRHGALTGACQAYCYRLFSHRFAVEREPRTRAKKPLGEFLRITKPVAERLPRGPKECEPFLDLAFLGERALTLVRIYAVSFGPMSAVVHDVLEQTEKPEPRIPIADHAPKVFCRERFVQVELVCLPPVETLARVVQSSGSDFVGHLPAVWDGHGDIVVILVKRDHDVLRASEKGMCAVVYAVEWGNVYGALGYGRPRRAVRVHRRDLGRFRVEVVVGIHGRRRQRRWQRARGDCGDDGGWRGNGCC